MNTTAPDTLANAMQKAAKLLRLAQSDNPHEAALAASRAQEIIDRYKLNMDTATMGEAGEIESNEPVECFGRDPLDRDKILQRWKAQLAMSIGKQNQVYVWRQGGNLNLVGRPSDVSTVRYFFTFIVREIERIASRDCKGCGRTYWNNFRLGAVETVTKKLAAQHSRTIEAVKTEAIAQGGMALVVVEKNLALMDKRTAEAKEFAHAKHKLKAGSSSQVRYDTSARNAGRQAGRSINVSGASHALGAGSAKLLN